MAQFHIEHRTVARNHLVASATQLLQSSWRLALITCIEDSPDFRVVYTFLAATEARVIELVVHVPAERLSIPSLAGVNYPAGRFEREIRDLYGIRPEGHPLPHRLLRHAHWPTGWYAMRRDADPSPRFDRDIAAFPFLEVEGAGVYEIPVGPVHAGMIEPGHFRFSVVGETILKMKARLWFVHRGIEKLFEGRRPEEGIELAERISGDTAVGHTLAYVMAIESAAGIDVGEDERTLRALLLEMERLYNHIADLGALANDTGFGVVNSHAQRLREKLLRLNHTVTGHRLLRGAIVIGGAQVMQLPDRATLQEVADEVEELQAITLAHSIVRDRFTGTAILKPEQAAAVGALGYVARASGQHVDARSSHPFVDLGPTFRVCVEESGDVLARYRVRVLEFGVSVRVILDLLDRLDGRTGSTPATHARGPASGLGIVEAWRGTVVHRVELDAAGLLRRVKIADPSFFNWPALPLALVDTIVPDFPLANKSFNQSYAGNDL